MKRADVEKAVREYFSDIGESPSEAVIQQRVSERIERMNTPKPTKPNRIQSVNKSLFRQL